LHHYDDAQITELETDDAAVPAGHSVESWALEGSNLRPCKSPTARFTASGLVARGPADLRVSVFDARLQFGV
jgi:hypothetical protein